ncbi:hypothetical protein E4U10_007674 [Claviceps purpurea]|nr:hypothetical protein E4U10_007674 [Claviceps purpurea]
MPHPDFQKVQASRPRPSNPPFTFTQTSNTNWTFGSGANNNNTTTTSQEPPDHISIDPYDPLRSAPLNYKLLISAITPRTIALLSTLSPDSRPNLAPYSYFNLIHHDPPLFVIGFSSPAAHPKDSLRNLLSTREAVINIISEPFLEAANSTSVDAPWGVSEWDVSGLTPVFDCEVVKAPRVKEAVFSVEVKIESVREWESRREGGEKTGVMVVLEGVRFWVRGDGIDEERSMVDPAILQPIGRMGGITYSRTNEAFELPRPKFEDDIGGQAGLEKIKSQADKSGN